MGKVTNKEMVEAIVNASPNLKASFEGVDFGDAKAVSEQLFQYQVTKDAFIDTLINKIFLTKIYSKVWENPLKMFHGGRKEYGYTLEEMYVEASEKVDFKSNFKGDAGSEIDNIIGTVVPKVYTNYMSRNFQDKYKVTVSDIELRTAFLRPNGLSELVSKLMEANVRGAYRDEYNYMKSLLFKYCEGLKQSETGVAGERVQKLQPTQVIDLNKATYVEELTVSLKAMNDRLLFESDKYNVSKVKQFSAMGDCVFITTPEHKAKLDFDVLAKAFNIDKAEVPQRIILMDEMPNKIITNTGETGATDTDLSGTKQVVGMLVDKDLIKFYDFIFETRYFNNADKLSTNYFLHKQGLVGLTPFLNGLVYTMDK